VGQGVEQGGFPGIGVADDGKYGQALAPRPTGDFVFNAPSSMLFAPAITLPLMSVGAKGVISVAANVVPARTAALCRAWLDGQPDEAKKIHYELMPLFKALFVETNPIPVKAAAAAMGLVPEEYRLPLCALADGNRKKLMAVLREMKLV